MMTVVMRVSGVAREFRRVAGLAAED